MRPNLKSELDKVIGLPHVSKSIKIIEDCFQLYKLNEIFICFNGGKDCTVLLILVIGTLQKLYDNFNQPLICMYAQTVNPFQEIEDFIEMCRHLYKLNIMTYLGGIKESLRQMLADRLDLKACFSGTKRSDPFSENLDYFQKTDNDWPQVVRVNPLLDWTYNEIWDFLNLLEIPYCTLYDQGYTSLGSQDDTVPNPILKVPNMNIVRYFPAYKLQDGKDERAGRILRKST